MTNFSCFFRQFQFVAHQGSCRADKKPPQVAPGLHSAGSQRAQTLHQKIHLMPLLTLQQLALKTHFLLDKSLQFNHLKQKLRVIFTVFIFVHCRIGGFLFNPEAVSEQFREVATAASDGAIKALGFDPPSPWGPTTTARCGSCRS